MLHAIGLEAPSQDTLLPPGGETEVAEHQVDVRDGIEDKVGVPVAEATWVAVTAEFSVQSRFPCQVQTGVVVRLGVRGGAQGLRAAFSRRGRETVVEVGGNPECLGLGNQSCVDGCRDAHECQRALLHHGQWNHEPGQTEWMRCCCLGLLIERTVFGVRVWWIPQTGVSSQDLLIGGFDHLAVQGIGAPGKSEITVNAFGQELQVRCAAPAR